jgi:inorganic pyrophosphatase
MMNLNKMPVFSNEMVNVIVETPKGSRNKFNMPL